MQKKQIGSLAPKKGNMNSYKDIWWNIGCALVVIAVIALNAATVIGILNAPHTTIQGQIALIGGLLFVDGFAIAICAI